MSIAVATVERPGKRALKFKFLFDPALVPDPEVWLSTRTESFVEVKILTSVAPANPDPAKSDQVDDGLAIAWVSAQ